MIQTLTTIIFGFFMGLKHAFDADHVIAVSTMASHQKNPLKTALIGAFWGIGHTTSLFLVGTIILIFKINISQNVAFFFELMVGIMLVLIGVKSLLYIRNTQHLHPHQHNKQPHIHFHDHSDKRHHHHQSFFIGVIHGLAGSGALLLLVLSTIKSTIAGIYYILLFGIGSIIGMSFISIILGLPFIYSTKKNPQVGNYLNTAAGVLSMGFGIYMIYQTGLIKGLFL